MKKAILNVVAIAALFFGIYSGYVMGDAIYARDITGLATGAAILAASWAVSRLALRLDS